MSADPEFDYGPATSTPEARAAAWELMLAAAGTFGLPEPAQSRKGTNHSGGPGWMDNTGMFGKPIGRKA